MFTICLHLYKIAEWLQSGEPRGQVSAGRTGFSSKKAQFFRGFLFTKATPCVILYLLLPRA